MERYLGIDLGTSSVKVLVCQKNGRIETQKVQSYDVLHPQEGWHEQHPVHWEAALKGAIEEIVAEAPHFLENVKGLSVTGQMHGIVPVDSDGNALYNAIIWSDQRNTEELSTLKAMMTNEEWVKLTGNRPNISFTLGKIMWFQKHYPDLYEKTYKFLLPKDYIKMKLTSTFDTDYSDASATLMMDLEEKNWSQQILTLTSLDLAKLPEMKESIEISGKVTEEAANHFGLKLGITVICGCGDAQAQAIGNGIVHEKNWLCTVGTSGQLFVSLDELMMEKNGTVHMLAHGAPGKWVMMGATLSAGMSFKWLTESIFRKNYSFTDLLDLASTSNPGANRLLFLPYLYGERTPHMDEKAKAAFIGLTNTHTTAEMARAVVEGVLFSLYQGYTIVKNATGKVPERLILTGGAAEHPLWLQTAADIFNIPVVRKASRGGGAYGAAMLAAIGVGDCSSLEDLAYDWGLQEEEEVYHPNSRNHVIYEKLFAVYANSYASLKGIYQDLHMI
ncbi:xylulokinase [Evansella tamaricis]|uniref:Xylulose kinase n=1 Tax=Evansella tamaricis TaxID=2069301 RepID=A0ABS6JDB6_9BACI|nr:xylulokinase [Evansella tamaricis]MBU9711664.1 xylulokinase [Evansella tamaricis]